MDQNSVSEQDMKLMQLELLEKLGTAVSERYLLLAELTNTAYEKRLDNMLGDNILKVRTEHKNEL